MLSEDGIVDLSVVEEILVGVTSDMDFRVVGDLAVFVVDNGGMVDDGRLVYLRVLIVGSVDESDILDEIFVVA